MLGKVSPRNVWSFPALKIHRGKREGPLTQRLLQKINELGWGNDEAVQGYLQSGSECGLEVHCYQSCQGFEKTSTVM